MNAIQTTCFTIIFTLFSGIITGSAQEMVHRKPNVTILATGGTIAGVGSSAVKNSYEPGKVAIGTLLEAVPQLNDIANVTGEQVVNIGSEHMTDQVMMALAKKVNQLMDHKNVDGIVITHGTDTMEETAFFLSLTTKGEKPVILVGAMRPSTSISADGPLNLYNAVLAAATPESVGKGVMVAMNGSLYPAEDVLKSHTINTETFQAPNKGAEGAINHRVSYFTPASPLAQAKTTPVFDISGLDSLPKVGIVYGHSNILPDMVAPMLQNGYKGIVYAGVGNGNIHKNVLPALEKARKEGVLVVRSTRVPTGPVTTELQTYELPYGFIASQYLNPQKSRILLMLALTRTGNYQEIQQFFDQY